MRIKTLMISTLIAAASGASFADVVINEVPKQARTMAATEQTQMPTDATDIAVDKDENAQPETMSITMHDDDSATVAIGE